MLAAEQSHAAGLAVLMGAPNVVRGGSHSGNIAAVDLAREGCLDVLSSDYVPGALIHAAFMLPEVAEEVSLPQAIRMVSATPAQGGASQRPRRDRGGQTRRPRAGADAWRDAGDQGRVAAGTARQLMAGALVLVVGPSGAGKDTLIAAAKAALAGDARYVFPQAGGDPRRGRRARRSRLREQRAVCGAAGRRRLCAQLGRAWA